MNLNTAIPDGLYNKALGLPESALAQVCRGFRLLFTKHAIQSFFEDRYRDKTAIKLPAEIRVDAANVVELEIESGHAIKAVVRFAFDNDLDLVLVIVPESPETARVKTLWLNLKSDRHGTLRHEVYRRWRKGGEK